jgi:hypothetical protein
VEHERGGKAGAAQAREEGGCAPATVVRGIDQALAP